MQNEEEEKKKNSKGIKSKKLCQFALGRARGAYYIHYTGRLGNKDRNNASFIYIYSETLWFKEAGRNPKKKKISFQSLFYWPLSFFRSASSSFFFSYIYAPIIFSDEERERVRDGILLRPSALDN